MIQIDIGCSNHKLDGFIGVDLELGSAADVIADMHNLPFRDSSIDIIHSRHTLEHVENPLCCISELFRASKPNAKMILIVPHYSNHSYWADMTHKRPFSYRSFEYYDLEYAKAAGFPIYLPEVNLKTIKKELIYWPSRIYSQKAFVKRLMLRILNRLFSGLANLSPFICERFWCAWVGGFYEVRFEIRAEKE